MARGPSQEDPTRAGDAIRRWDDYEATFAQASRRRRHPSRYMPATGSGTRRGPEGPPSFDFRSALQAVQDRRDHALGRRLHDHTLFTDTGTGPPYRVLNPEEVQHLPLFSSPPDERPLDQVWRVEDNPGSISDASYSPRSPSRLASDARHPMPRQTQEANFPSSSFWHRVPVAASRPSTRRGRLESGNPRGADHMRDVSAEFMRVVHNWHVHRLQSDADGTQLRARSPPTGRAVRRSRLGEGPYYVVVSHAEQPGEHHNEGDDSIVVSPRRIYGDAADQLATEEVVDEGRALVVHGRHLSVPHASLPGQLALESGPESPRGRGELDGLDVSGHSFDGAAPHGHVSALQRRSGQQELPSGDGVRDFRRMRETLRIPGYLALDEPSRGPGARRCRSREHSSAALPSRPLPEGHLTSCALLRNGMAFCGEQSYVGRAPALGEAWKVRVVLTQVDWTSGRLCGTMTAYNIPNQDGPITTYWKGEIIDMRHATFLSTQYNTLAEMDLMNWMAFPAFAKLPCCSPSDLARLDLGTLDSCGSIFMRWKEHSFLSKMYQGSLPALTIAGYYYMCLDRATGDLTGLYHDPANLPGQRLDLQPAGGSRGFSFNSILFA